MSALRLVLVMAWIAFATVGAMFACAMPNTAVRAATYVGLFVAVAIVAAGLTRQER